jgi:dihydrodipicolinate synthase/N-acetylneuraminate lyase
MDLKKFAGMIAPMVVPFDAAGELDEAAFRAEARYLLDHGVDGISSGGSTGEGALLSDGELRRCLEIIGEENSAKIPVYAGIIRNSTRDVIRAGQDAKACGADVLLVTPVFYHGATAEGNFEFYRAICEAVKLPVIIYNVVASNLITPEQFQRISKIDGVIGIKQVDPVRLAEICAMNDGAYNVYAACDQLLYGTYAAGACGAFSAMVTIAPELCQRQWQAFKRGDQAEAMAIHAKIVPIVMTYLQPPYPGKVKALINLQGRSGGVPRNPILPVPEGELLERMRIALKNAGIIA